MPKFYIFLHMIIHIVTKSDKNAQKLSTFTAFYGFVRLISLFTVFHGFSWLFTAHHGFFAALYGLLRLFTAFLQLLTAFFTFFFLRIFYGFFTAVYGFLRLRKCKQPETVGYFHKTMQTA